jgi:HAD superfamily hydrolase (TIGR01490 family)
VAEHRDEAEEHAATDEERIAEEVGQHDERGVEFASAAAAAAAAGQETEQRYARPDADRLSDEMLEEIARRSTGAKEAAFFDLDKTIIAKSSTLVMGRTFYRDGLISSSMVLKTLYAQVVYQLAGADHERMEQARHAALELTRGWDADRIRHLVRETMEETIAPLAYQEALDLIASHRRAGRDVWIVSSGGEEIVEPYSEFIGVREVIATRSGIDDEGRYDGTLEFYAYAGAKATAIRQIAEVRGYDLSRCFAYSRLHHRPADAVGGRPPHRGQPGQGAARRRRGDGLAGPGVRVAGTPARPAARRSNRQARPPPALVGAAARRGVRLALPHPRLRAAPGPPPAAGPGRRGHRCAAPGDAPTRRPRAARSTGHRGGPRGPVVARRPCAQALRAQV